MANKRLWLKHVFIDRLHGELTISAEFNKGINVIYGDNGVGKTTLLHILSNIANFDFSRFRHISFEEASLTMNDGTTISVVMKKKSEVPTVSINGEELSVSESMPEGSEAERALFHKYFGKRPVYVPAFRNVLQKMDDRQRNPWDTLNVTRGLLNMGKDILGDESKQVQAKTEQCRDWFGKFVPIIRYPSVEEAEAELESYWVRADSAARREQARIVSEATNQILADLLGQTPNELKEIIDSLLDDLPETGIGVGEIREDFAQAIARAGHANKSKENNPTEMAVLYVSALIEARSSRNSLFKKIDRFTQSMNRFLGPDRDFVIGGKYSNKPKPKIAFRNSAKRDYYISGLSSGERQLLTLLFAAWQGPDESKLMLIDEPEISLHIDWQRRILEEMHKQSEQQIIACTHSPEVAADLDSGYQVFDRFSFEGRPRTD
ncbi:AAA family ATPase [Sulfitobacter sp. 1A12157]|uniref:AAA family ATPase n=1 Tax=Sulfitobacter sp. 1A12157 TaxID=3368594 RepID=UPI003745F138